VPVYVRVGLVVWHRCTLYKMLRIRPC